MSKLCTLALIMSGVTSNAQIAGGCKYMLSNTSITSESYDANVRIAGKTTTGAGIPFTKAYVDNSYSTSNKAGIEDCILSATNGVMSNMLTTSDIANEMKINIKYIFSDLGT